MLLRSHRLLRACVHTSAAEACVATARFQEAAPSASGRPENSTRSSLWGWCSTAATAAAVFALTPLAEQPAHCEPAAAAEEDKAGLLPHAMQKRVFFKYEKRMRELSTTEKIYDYFSTHELHPGQKTMTPLDLLRAIVAIYPPDSAKWLRSGGLPGDNSTFAELPVDEDAKELFSNFDVDNDGTISYTEYLLVLVLVCVPLKDIQAIFSIMDADDSGTLERHEFWDLVTRLRSFGLQPGRQTASLIAKPGFTATDEGHSCGIMRSWFGEDGSRKLKLEEFQAFLERLHEVLERLEFSLLDTDNDGTISGLDLARSWVAPANVKIIDSLLDRAENMPEDLKTLRVSMDSFKAAQKIRRKYHRISFALRFWQDTGHELSEKHFCGLVKNICNAEISEDISRIFFHVFQASDGRFDGRAMAQTLKYKFGRYSMDVGDNEPGLLACLINCVKPTQP